MPSDLCVRQTLVFFRTPERQHRISHFIGKRSHILNFIATGKGNGDPLLIGYIFWELDLLPLG